MDQQKARKQVVHQPIHMIQKEINSCVAITENGNVSLNKGLISGKNNLYFAKLLFHEYRHAFQYFGPYIVGGKRYANRYDAWTELYGPGVGGERGRWEMMELDAYFLYISCIKIVIYD